VIDVTRFIAIESLLEVVTMTSTLSRINSAAISATRSGRPSAHAASQPSLLIQYSDENHGLG
jgi:L-asparagine transporter-like permease